MAESSNASTINFAKPALLERARDAANYVGPIDMDDIEKSFEESFERFVFAKGGQKVSLEEFIAQGENLDTTVMTAHPTFFKSKEEAGLLSKLFTAYAAGREDEAQELEAQVSQIQADHPYKDPTTDEEGERLYEALGNTVTPGQMMQRAMIKVAKKNYPEEWKEGRYSPFSRAIWQKFDRDGREIPPNVQLGESLRQRRMGLELIYLPQLKALQEQDGYNDKKGTIQHVIDRMENTAEIYQKQEDALADLDDENIDMDALQSIIDDLYSNKEARITHPDELVLALRPILKSESTPDALFEGAKLIVDNLQANGLCFATPTHRVNAEDVHSYLDVERRKSGKGFLSDASEIGADGSHFDETEKMIAAASDEVAGAFTDVLSKAPKDGKPIHEMMMIRRFIYDAIDSHTIEKIDIAEAHNAMTQRGLRLAAKQYGVSGNTDIGLLHEDAGGIDNARKIYAKLLQSEQYIDEISHTIPGTTKKRPRLVMKIGYSDFAKQQSAAGGKPSNEKCLLQTIKAIHEAGLSDKIDLDIEFAGGEGPGRRVNPLGYEWTLKETVTPAVLAFASQNGIRLKYRETIQGGDGCILLGTEESAAKIMSTRLDHLSKNLTADPDKVWDAQYYQDLKSDVSEHHQLARHTFDALYQDPDFALLMKLHKELCVKGGSRKVSRGELKSPYDKDDGNAEPLADFRAIGFNAASINTGIHITPAYGQGSAFDQNMDRTERLVESKLFRERLIPAFMVHDLQMMDELKDFIELYNPEYWKESSKRDDNGRETTESHIARRLDKLIYPDGSQERIYPRLKRAVRLIEDDFEKFDQAREKYDFSDIESKIAVGNYQERLENKRALLSAIHKNRRETIKQVFIALEESPVFGEDYSRSERHHAIHAGMCGNTTEAFRILGVKGDTDLVGALSRNIKGHSISILDLRYNA